MGTPLDLARRSLRAIAWRLRRLPPPAAVLVGIVVLPIWAVTIGLTAVLFEAISRIDDARGNLAKTSRPLPSRVRWSAAGAAWLAIAVAVTGSGGPADSIPAVPRTATVPEVTIAPLPGSPQVPNPDAGSPIVRTATASPIVPPPAQAGFGQIGRAHV